MATVVRGIRGAITVDQNNAQEIFAATQELLHNIIDQNQINPEDICSVFFTATSDLNAAFPARAARAMGWDYVPLMCTPELNVAGALPKCIRVLIHVNTSKGQQEIKHVYLREAGSLRPDLVTEKA